MKAFRFTNVAGGLELVDVPVPRPGRDQILVQIKATGLCHTDCNIISGKDDTFFWQRPITLGHEIAGVIAELGPNVTEFGVGDRVAAVIGVKIPISLGDVTTSAGIGYDGGFAEYVVLNTTKTVTIPDGVSFAQAAVATDAVATAYRAVSVEGQVTAGSKVAIIGLGGLGLSAVQIASRLGAKVYGIDIETKKYVVALQAGASVCAKSIEFFGGVKFDVVIDFAGTGATTAAAVKAVKAGGKVVLVGLSSKQAVLPTYEFIALGVTLQGSAGSSIEDVREVLNMIAKGELNPILEEIPFDEIAGGLTQLGQGGVLGRLYADPTKIKAVEVAAC